MAEQGGSTQRKAGGFNDMADWLISKPVYRHMDICSFDVPPRLGMLIESLFSLCCNDKLYSSGRALYYMLEHFCEDLIAATRALVKSGSDVG